MTMSKASSRPKGATTVMLSSASSRTPTAKAGATKRGRASAVQAMGVVLAELALEPDRHPTLVAGLDPAAQRLLEGGGDALDDHILGVPRRVGVEVSEVEIIDPIARRGPSHAFQTLW
jgi:hypothetical protein